MPREPDGIALERLLTERGDQLMRAAIALTGSRQRLGLVRYVRGGVPSLAGFSLAGDGGLMLMRT